MDCKGGLDTPSVLQLDRAIWTSDAKVVGSKRSKPHCPKIRIIKHQAYLGSNIVYPINEHCRIDICPKSCLSPNINILKSITHVEKLCIGIKGQDQNLKGKNVFSDQTLKVC